MRVSELEKHLTLLKQQNLIDEWHDRRIAAGGERYHSGDDRDVTGRPVLVASDLRSRISEVNERTSAAAAGLLAVTPVTACEVGEEIEPTERARAEDR